jgi:hypothetical protein
MANEMKVVKDLGWDHLSLSAKGYKGAVQAYQSSNGGKIALCFNMHEAFIVSDDQGLFGTADLEQGVVKNKDVDIDATGEIVGAEVLAWEEDGEVGYAEDRLTQLGINDFSVKESLKARLIAVAGLDKMIDMPMN